MSKVNEIDFKIDFKKIGKNIKEERLKKGLTHEDLSGMAGLSTVHISHIESGSAKMSLESFAKICFALGVNPDRILLEHIYTAQEYLIKAQLSVFYAFFKYIHSKHNKNLTRFSYS